MSHNPNNNIDLNDEIQEQFERYNLLLQEKQKEARNFMNFLKKIKTEYMNYKNV